MLEAIRFAAAVDSAPQPLMAAIERFEKDVRPPRAPNQWMFASGPYTFVARIDGLHFLVNATSVLRAPTNMSSSYIEDDTGKLVSATIHGVPLADIRPEANARAFLLALNSERTVIARQPELLPPTAATSLAGLVKDRLDALDELRASGVISDDEYASKRATVIDAL